MKPSLTVAASSLLSTVLFLGLAVLGWGGLRPFFGHPPRLVLAVETFALAIVALFSAGNLSRGEREDRGNRWVIAAFGVLGLVAAWLPAYTERRGLWILDGDAVR